MQKLASFLGHLFLNFVQLLMVAGGWPFRDFAKEVMNSELESVHFGQKGMETRTKKVKKRCTSNAKMHFRGKNNMSAASKKPKYASL